MKKLKVDLGILLKNRMLINKNVNLKLLYLFLFLIGITVIYFGNLPKGFLWDVNSYSVWTMYIKEFGIQNAYINRVDYPPTAVYFFGAISFFYGNASDILLNHTLLKQITLLFTFLNGFYIYKIVHELNPNKNNRLLSFFWILNPAILFNGIFWGQLDEIMVFFMLTSVFYLVKKQPLTSLLLLFLGLNFKVQFVIFLPIFCFLFLFSMPKKQILDRQTLAKLLVFFGLVFIFYLPFYLNHQFYYFKKVLGFVDTFPKVTVGAYNLWYLLIENSSSTPDNVMLYNIISCKNIGYILFFGITLIASIRLIYWVLIKKISIDYNEIFISLAIHFYSFFFMLTQMHERYIHLFLPICLILVGYRNKLILILYLTVTISYFFNMHSVYSVSYPSEIVSLNIDPILISQLYLISFLLLIIIWMRKVKQSLKVNI